MTYADIKNQFKTVEEINSRLSEINATFEAHEQKVEEQNDKDLATLQELLKPILPEGWTVTQYSPKYSIQISKGDDTWHSITVYAKYEIDMKDDCKEVWKFTMNPSWNGEFDVFGDSDLKMYYKVVGILMTNEGVMHQLDETLHSMTDYYREMNKEYRDLRSEEKQLSILKKNIEETEQSKNILETVKTIEDKTSIVIIDKNADPEKAVGTHRGTPVTIVSLPVPNDEYEEELKKCKEMAKMNKAARYIPTQVRFIKLY